MLTISQYQENIAGLMKRVTDIDARCMAESRDLSEQEINQKNKMMDDIDAIKKMVNVLERQERISDVLGTPQERLTVETKKSDGDAHKIEVGENRASRDKFHSFGQQMAAVMRAGIPGGHVDPRLLNIRASASGLNETVPSEGGFLIQQDFSRVLLNDVFETGLLASRCKRVQISNNSNSMKFFGVDETSRVSSRSGGVVGYWGEEAGEKTASKPKFRKVELNLKKLIGLCYATDELLDDAVALESYVRDSFVKEFGFLLDEAIINGTGAADPMGIMNSGGLVTVSKEPGQQATTVVTENIVNMYSRIFPNSRNSAVWLINQSVLPQLFTMSIGVGTGGIPVYMPAGGIYGQPYSTLFGIPVLSIEQCAALGTTGDIILADFANGYILAEKGGIQSDMSIHVRFIYDESVFRFILRVDGQPVRASALTPYKGGANATQGHFIALQTRS